MTTRVTKFVLPSFLALGFLVRLYKIDNPVADWHSWRQADTAAVTRNWMKSGLNPLAPRYDDFSDVSGNGLFNPQGYRFVEFPLFNIFHYFLAVSFPFKSLEYWGRITAILCSLVSAVLLYLLVRRYLPESCALLSCAFFLFLPYNIYFSRVILPDPLMVTLWLGSLLFFDLYVRPSTPPLAREARGTRSRGGRGSYLLVSMVFASLALLVKPTSIFFLLPIVWQARVLLRDKRFYLAIMAVIGPVLLWRAYSHFHPEGIPSSYWLLNGNRIRFRPAFFRWLFGERLGKMFLGSWGLWPFLTGMLASIPYFAIWGIGALLYVIVFATGNIQHDYYQIPVVPIVAIFLAIGFIKLWHLNFFSKVLVVFCTVLMLGLTWYDLRGNYIINRWEIIEAGQAVDRLTPADAVVVAPYLGDTAFLYQTNRWGFPVLPLPIKDLIDRFNATYYVSVNYDSDTTAIMKKYTVIEQTPRYVVVKLIEPLRP